ncbi:P-loop containing nucleoside triphosphate hydrolase protein [Auriculariales sp. MPI-PUGE-AT-0066]|nr:P-loop containing nucleoside triphosphate hydrolase protein [Auriculariales sp. MPI-PUGE-AT-0066]
MVDWPDAEVDPLILWLEIALNAVLPALVVSVTLLTAAGGSKSRFGNIISDEDVGEERSGVAAVDFTPLPEPTRTLKSWTYAAYGAVELVAHVLILVNHVQAHRGVVAAAVNVVVWIYGTVAPIVTPTRGPPYPLFALYLVALVEAVITITVLALTSTFRTGIPDVLYPVHVAVCLAGVATCLTTRLVPEKAFAAADASHEPAALDDGATLGQWLTASWFQPLLDRARRGNLEDSDVMQIAADSKTRLLTRKFLPFLPHQKLLTRLLKANAGDLVVFVLTTIIDGTLLCVQPILLRHILAAIEAPASQHDPDVVVSQQPLSASAGRYGYSFPPNMVSAYLYTLISFGLLVLRAHVGVIHQVVERRWVVRARSMALGAVYAKALVRIDTTGVIDTKGKKDGITDGKADIGKLISHVSGDTQSLRTLPIVLRCAFETPINIIISGLFLYDILGYSAFVGYLFFVVVMPLTGRITTAMIAQYRVVAKFRDARNRAINEALQSIKFIKFSAWETRWIGRIMKRREDELSQFFKFQMIQVAFQMIWEVVPVVVGCINLSWYTAVAGHQLTLSTAFPALLALAQLTSELNSLPAGFSFYSMLVAAMERIDDFLQEDEVPTWMSSLKHDPRKFGDAFDTRLGAANATFQWHATSQKEADKNYTPKAQAPIAPWYNLIPRMWFQKAMTPNAPIDVLVPEEDEDQRFMLRNINVLFPRGKLSVITGPTGSGKSSLLAALLGEMDCVSGHVLLPKTGHLVDVETGLHEGVSFCAQQPWLQSKSIRENILFGSPVEEERYNAVVDACALLPDLKQLDNGDATQIGDKGIVLSGGQKARVALARAVYARTKTVLLDDVLSAVDTHTQAFLVERCFFGPLMANRTVVLVTHHFISIADRAGWIIRIDNGSIVTQGPPDELLKSGELSKIAREEKTEEAEAAVETKQKGATESAKVATEEGKSRLIEAETKESGSVRLNVYGAYLKAASYWVVALFLASLLIQHAGALAEKVWVNIWTSSYDKHDGWRGPFGFRSASVSVIPYVLVYTGLELASLTANILANIPSVLSSIRASRTLFYQLLDSVFRSPTRFFDKTPTGRVLSRFTKDIDSADTGVMHTLRNAAFSAISLVISAALMLYGVPIFIVPLVLLAWLHIRVARGYITASRDLVRLESTMRSPYVTLFIELLHGLMTIRAFNGETQFMESMYKLVDRFQWAVYSVGVSQVWLRYRFDMLGAATFVLSAISTLYLGVAPGLVAIILVQIQSVLSNMYFGVTNYVQMENAMNAVERIQEYIALPSEPPRHLASLPASWPLLGEGITFKDLVLRYAPDLDPVLRGVSFHIKAGEKVGVVGRTGSGKSTLAMSLFRFVEPDSGQIIVDGRDITTVGVQDLRQHLTLIPQDAVLYSGTIRDNLDPFNEHTDAECIHALRMAQLPVDSGDAPLAIPGTSSSPASGTLTPAPILVTLESQVSDSGANWSAGQRQLIAMARALIRNSGIIVLDESTASVDFETDKKIQNIIREQLKGSTLLTIAHRLNTIIDYDRIMVLDQGKIVEFDTPSTLIAQTGGVFRGMCEKSGQFAELKRAANDKVLILSRS